jgi:predicted lipoprotein with Yx(FWY)xxD motif
MKKIVSPVILLLLAGAMLVAGCSQGPAVQQGTPTPTPVPDTIKLASNPQYGQILADATGKTLYYFAKDTPGTGTSVCTAGCPGAWPAFHAATIKVSPPLNSADFGEITRADGQKQTTWKGWPLYYYANDAAPGDVRGYGINNIWFVISPSGIVTLALTTTISTPVQVTPMPTTTTTAPTTARTTALPTTYYGGGGGGY